MNLLKWISISGSQTSTQFQLYINVMHKSNSTIQVNDDKKNIFTRSWFVD